MKQLLNRFLLLFSKKHFKVQVEGCFKYRVEYKVLFGNEYVIYKTLPPIGLSRGDVELPFDFSLPVNGQAV
ncbi:hypothetical protein [Desulfonema magnum]|uniref:Uncharacterized protein n=1 Tax=Desulfonema magnum TaxID=45655 RepID=A0A975GR74_9BACT|nr:hypothetical protein [Desulfonema magnum]QTA89743.1 Uncharacterized protein dnm_058000 [Desulfonema magnum]